MLQAERVLRPERTPGGYRVVKYRAKQDVRRSESGKARYAYRRQSTLQDPSNHHITAAPRFALDETLVRDCARGRPVSRTYTAVWSAPVSLRLLRVQLSPAYFLEDS